MRELNTEVGARAASGIYPTALDCDFAARVAVWISFIAFGTYLVGTGSVILMITGGLLNGLMFVHGVELQHQCLHNTAFRRKSANRWVGIALGIPIGVSYTAYQNSHLWHHRFLGTSRNREFFEYQNSEIMNFQKMLRYAFNYKRVPMFLRKMFRSLFALRSISPMSTDEIQDYLLILIAAVLLVTISISSVVLERLEKLISKIASEMEKTSRRCRRPCVDL